MVRISDLLTVSNDSSLLYDLYIVPPHPRCSRGSNVLPGRSGTLWMWQASHEFPASDGWRTGSRHPNPSPGFVTAVGTSCFQGDDLERKNRERVRTAKMEAP